MSKGFLTTLVIGILALVIFAYFILVLYPQPTNNTPAQDVLSQLQSATQPSPSEKVKIEDITVGAGREIKSGDTAVMHYTGTLTNGTKFDSSYDHGGEPFETKIGVGQVIAGWDQGVVGMKVGGKRKLTIPPSLGYGSQDMGSIPPNSILIFELELVDIK